MVVEIIFYKINNLRELWVPMERFVLLGCHLGTPYPSSQQPDTTRGSTLE